MDIEQRLAAIEMRLSVLESRANANQFKPPTVDEVAKHLFDKNRSTDTELSAFNAKIIAEDFCDHFESNGWMVGRVKMKSWRHAANRWLRNQRQWKRQGQSSSNTPIYHKPI